MSKSLLVCELFKSIQGESTFAGCVCGFIRLSGCNLSCSYCDTAYAASGGTLRTIDELVAAATAFDCSIIEITGGEPLMQSSTPDLAAALIKKGKTVLVETNGSFDIGVLPDACVKIVDVKCPSSGEAGSFLVRNLAHLSPHDEIKFVIGSREDFDWAVSFVREHALEHQFTLLFSPLAQAQNPAGLAAWILESGLPLRLQLQLHKIIWGDKRGV